jgi:hypothetical protein
MPSGRGGWWSISTDLYARGCCSGDNRVLDEIRKLQEDIQIVLGNVKTERMVLAGMVELYWTRLLNLMVGAAMIYAVAARSARLRHQNQKPSNVP